MKNLFFLLVALFLPCGILLSNDLPAQSQAIKPGVYELVGTNFPSSKLGYTGTVTIKQQGSLYALEWNIGPQQHIQLGTAILQDSILSVVFYDPAYDIFGVVSYKIVDENNLEGMWAPMNGAHHGVEHLQWKGETS